MPNVVDEPAHGCPAIRVARRLKAAGVIGVLSDPFILRGVPGHVRPDDGPGLAAKAAQEWIAAVGAKTACTAPGSPLQGHPGGPGPCGTGSAALLPMGGRLHREPQRAPARRSAAPLPTSTAGSSTRPRG